MKKKWVAILVLGSFLNGNLHAQKNTVARKVATGEDDRKFWLTQMDKMLRPVFRSLAHDSLRYNMPTVVSIHIDNPKHARKSRMWKFWEERLVVLHLG